MDRLQDFVTQMVSQIPDRRLAEMDGVHVDEHALLKASFLWSMLQLIHEDLHALCRRNPQGKLGAMSVQAVNRAFDGVKRFLKKIPQAEFLQALEPGGDITHADALVVLSQYRAALRWYRIDQLHEDPFAF